MRRCLSLFVVLLVPLVAWAETVRFRGAVLDGSGAMIAGATVQAYFGDALVAETRTGDFGRFELRIAPGAYLVVTTSVGFQSRARAVEVTADMELYSISLDLAPVEETIEVQEEGERVSLDPSLNLTALVLREEELQDLPDDEEELAAFLRELAGPQASASGGVDFIVDGFSGGRLPPKDQIQEVRINSNSFTTEYSRPGHGRIEVTTRPGTGELRGNLVFNFSDEALNARNALAEGKPPYQRRSYRLNLSGSVIRDHLSLALFANQNEQDKSSSVRAITPEGLFTADIVRPNLRRRFNARGQVFLEDNHTLRFNVRYGSNRRENQGVGGFSLPERASSSRSSDIGFQLKHRAVLSESMIHETRFEFGRDTSRTSGLTDGVAINVLGAFRKGSAPNRSEDRERSYEFGNTLTYTSGKLTFRTGFQGDYTRIRSVSESNFDGTFVFSSLEDFLASRPITFTVNQGDPLLTMSQLEAGAFLQNDLRLSQRFNLSFGLRYEAQTNLGDGNNWDPRMGFAYSIGRSTVLRGGAGVFHQRLSDDLVTSLLRLDGTRQQQLVIRRPSYPDPPAPGAAEGRSPPSVRSSAADLAAPYTVNSSLSIERAFSNGLVLTASYDFIRGVHLFRSRNINAPLPGATARPDLSRGNVLQLESTGTSEFQGVTLGFRHRSSVLTMFGRYTYASSLTDAEGAFSLPANHYNLGAEWGPSGNTQDHRVFTGINLRLPWGVSLNTLIDARSGRPYTITTGFDDNHDTVANDRPAGVGRNSEVGPGFFSLNLNVSKTVPLGAANGRESASSPNADRGRVERSGPRPVGRGGGLRGGSLGRSVRSRGVSVTLFADIRNLLNRTNLDNFSGVMTSAFFGRANSARDPREIRVGLRINF